MYNSDEEADVVVLEELDVDMGIRATFLLLLPLIVKASVDDDSPRRTKETRNALVGLESNFIILLLLLLEL
jgi:hypothetical protein